MEEASFCEQSDATPAGISIGTAPERQGAEQQMVRGYVGGGAGQGGSVIAARVHRPLEISTSSIQPQTAGGGGHAQLLAGGRKTLYWSAWRDSARNMPSASNFCQAQKLVGRRGR